MSADATPSPVACRAPSPLPPVCVVVDVRLRGETATLVVQSADRQLHELVLEGLGTGGDEPEDAPAGPALAVRVELIGPEGSAAHVASSSLVSTPRGPERRPLPVAAALHLIDAGVHAVVTASSRAGRARDLGR